MKPNFLIRADANTQMGTGHIMRCMALAQAWQAENGAVQLIASEIPVAIQERLSTEGIDVISIDASPNSQDDITQTIATAKHLGATWLVVDGYQFDADYQQAIKQAGLNLLFVDDYGHAKHYYADIVLNQNISASKKFYQNREPYTELLLGAKHALLRREFWPYNNWQRQTPASPCKVLVTFGGGDPDNATLKVIQALQQLVIENLEAIVVVGGSNPYYETLQAKSAISKNIHLVQNVANMPKLMAWADVAISAGGSTCWELAFMGLPNLIITLADNQKPIAEALDQVGVAVNLGWHNKVLSHTIAVALLELSSNSQKMIEMSKYGQQLVDGFGGKRIVRELESRSVQ